MKQCTTHHHACACRETLIKAICRHLLYEHRELSAFMAGFAKPQECDCKACKAARILMDGEKA